MLGAPAPGLGTGLVAGRDHIERPDDRAGVDVECVDPSVDSYIGTGVPDEDLACERNRGARDFITQSRIRYAYVPKQLAAQGIQCEQMPVDGSPEHLAVVESNTAVVG